MLLEYSFPKERKPAGDGGGGDDDNNAENVWNKDHFDVIHKRILLCNMLECF